MNPSNIQETKREESCPLNTSSLCVRHHQVLLARRSCTWGWQSSDAPVDALHGPRKKKQRSSHTSISMTNQGRPALPSYCQHPSLPCGSIPLPRRDEFSAAPRREGRCVERKRRTYLWRSSTPAPNPQTEPPSSRAPVAATIRAAVLLAASAPQARPPAFRGWPSQRQGHRPCRRAASRRRCAAIRAPSAVRTVRHGLATAV